jgi:signal transduction histidine kinase
MQQKSQPLQIVLPVFLGAILLAGLYWLSLINYPLFHTFAELFSILIGWMVFLLAWNSRRFLENGYLLLIGISLLFVGVIDLFHTLAYKGVALFPGYDTNLPTQLWIAGRYLQSLALLIAPFWIHRRLNVAPVLAGFSLATIGLLTAIFAGYFPVCYVEGVGLTPFKIVSEYVIDGILALSILLLWRNGREAYDRRVLHFLILAILSSIVAELAFTFYVNVYGLSNLIGHYFKILSFYFFYKAIIETGFTRPFELLFHDLHQRELALQASHRELESSNQRLQEAFDQAEQHSKELVAVFSELNQAQTTLKDYTQKLEASNRELEQFAFVASHDLQEPLRKIESFSAMISEKAGASLGETERDYLERMQSAAKRMRKMIDDLLALSRVTSQGQPFTRVDLTEVTQAVLDDLGVRIRQTNGLVEVGELPVIQADPLQMHQLLQNLISNALKFRRSETAPIVKIHAEANSAQQTIICVEDNGVGFDMQKVSRLFQPFHRLHSRSQFEGSGIGLAICRKIVERHGGSISAWSEPGKGSIFSITLPENSYPSLQNEEVP